MWGAHHDDTNSVQDPSRVPSISAGGRMVPLRLSASDSICVPRAHQLCMSAGRNPFGGALRVLRETW